MEGKLPVSILLGTIVGLVGAYVNFRFILFARKNQPRSPSPFLLIGPFVLLGIFAGLVAVIFFGMRAINMSNSDNMLTAIISCAIPSLVMGLFLATRNKAQWEKWKE